MSSETELSATRPEGSAALATPTEPAGAPRHEGDEFHVAPGSRLLGRLISVAFVLAAVGSAVSAYLYPERAREFGRRVGILAQPRPPAAERGPDRPEPAPWDGRITLTPVGARGLGVVTAPVKPQTEPLRVELHGTTSYDDDNLSKIRSMFRARVDKVYHTVGQTVRKGDPLIDLYSKELAEAKRQYEIEHIQWQYDRNLLKARENLLKTSAISNILYLETQNNEMKSKREYEVARDNLLVFGLSEADVENVEREVGAQKARMTLRAPADGLVIERDVVPGNLYDENDTLLVTAPLDRLWVWGHVFESDLNLVRVGQDWEIRFPYLVRKPIMGKVEYVSNRVDPVTRSVKIRTTIPNPEGLFKADMLVRSSLLVPPVAGRTVIPRSALIVADGHNNYVFLRVPGPGDGPSFERRSVEVVQEKENFVLVGRGLDPGQEVASVGALVLNQMAEERDTAHARDAREPSPAAEGR